MLFKAKTLSTLEFDKITERLADLCSTEGAKSRALSLMPSDDYDTVLVRQRRTDDAKRLVNAKGYPPFFAPESVLGAAERAYKGGTLSPRELLDIASLLRSARLTLDYINNDKLFETTLDEIFKRLLTDRALEDKIYKAILSEDMIADECRACRDKKKDTCNKQQNQRYPSKLRWRCKIKVFARKHSYHA